MSDPYSKVHLRTYPEIWFCSPCLHTAHQDQGHDSLAYKSSEGRGSSVEIMLEDGLKYCCVGSKAQRAAKGVRTFHHAIETIEDDHQKRILSYIRMVEQLFREWVDTAIIRQVWHGIQLVSASTFEVYNFDWTCVVVPQHVDVQPPRLELFLFAQVGAVLGNVWLFLKTLELPPL